MSRFRTPGQHRGNKALFGFIIVLVGVGLFLRQTGLIPDFDINVTWPIILIAVGLFIGVKNRFSNNAPYILIAVGVFNLIPAFSFHIGNRLIDSEDLVIPAVIIIAGLIIIFKPRKKKNWVTPEIITANNDQTVIAEVLFGGRKEIITSKDFRGGRITATFGGCEINLLQADSSQQNITLDIRATFGGCEIIVPTNWDVKNEIETFFGSVEDQRMLRPANNNEERKTLTLRGSCFMGGVEIKSF